MTVTSFESFYFAHDLPDLQVAYDHECTVTFTINEVGRSKVQTMGYDRDYYIENAGADYAYAVIEIASIEETYYPDENGNITLRGLRDLMMCYLHDFSKDEYKGDSTKWFNPCLELVITISASSTSSDEIVPAPERFHTAVYYSRVNSATSPLFHVGFLSQYRQRTITPDMPMLFSYIYFAGLTVRCRVVYLAADNSLQELVQELPVSTSLYESACHDFDIIMREQTVMEFSTICHVEADHIVSVTFERYAEDDGSDYVAHAVLDRIVFKIDHGHCRQKTKFWFTNCFGVPEVELLTGSDTRSDEMEAEFSHINNRYRKVFSELTEQHQVYSGFVSSEQYNSLLDLVSSDQAYLIDDAGNIGDEVTFTELEASDKRPHIAPTSLKLKYRAAEKQLRRLDRTFAEHGRIFDDSFDTSFE